MSLPASPRLLPAAEISGDFRPKEDHECAFSSELPVRTQFSPLKFSQVCNKDMSVVTVNRANTTSGNNLTQHASMTHGPEAMHWSSQSRFVPHNLTQDASSFCALTNFNLDSSGANYPHQGQNRPSFDVNYSPIDYTTVSSCALSGTDLSGLSNDVNASYPPSAYFHAPPDMSSTLSLPYNSSAELMQLTDDYDLVHSNFVNHEDRIDSTSLYPRISRTSTPYSVGHGMEDPIDKEQPYAQLIFRALLSAPQHTMVLRDIYDWFKAYTDKATHSETKGWQNSIRHNLSMNGAFEKVDSPADASTRGFMWRLTPAALREGVKSTTRYRSKAPNKRPAHRAQPLPQRQASGAKGGHAARRAANSRLSQRARELSYHTPNNSVPRSEPYSAAGYGSKWDDSSMYASSVSCPSPLDSPYSQMSFSPYQAPKDDTPFSPVLGMTSHLMSPPHNHAGRSVTPVTPRFVVGDAAYVLQQAPDEPLFSGSPTPPADEPITPTNASGHSGWEQDVLPALDVYDNLSHFGSAI